MKIRYIHLSFVVLIGVGGLPVLGQSADVAAPRQREVLMESAASLMKERATPVVVAEDVANPFLWPAEASVPSVTEEPSVPAPAAMDSTLLARLAARIPATGTVSLGGEFILLLGQKRLKVGDTITISFEGQNYELSIADIASTSFTVMRGSLSHTRATHLTNSSSGNFRP